jgi:AcrR family transcriptional regulator
MTQSESPRQSKASARSIGRGDTARGSAEETRRRLIEAALVTFGRFGFDGASTREIAKRASVNLAAIPYHFGGKEGLHRAVAEHIVAEIDARVGSNIDSVYATLEMGDVSPDQAGMMLQMIAERAAEVILGHPEARLWAPFILREQMEPSATFDVIYDGFLGRAHKAATALFARATGRPAEDPETIASVFTLLGQFIVFRIGPAMIERRLGWKGYGPDEIAMIKGIIHRNIGAMIEAGKV